MDDALPVRIVERARDLKRDLHRVLHVQLPLPLETLVNGLARDERHHVVHLPLELAVIVDGENVRMTQTRDNVDLATKALRAQGESQFAEEHFDRDFSTEL